MNESFKQTDIGLIPEDWILDIIGNHFDIKQGKQLSKRTRVGNNQKKFLRTANVFWGKLDLSELDEMHFTKEEEEKLKLLYNDLLVCEGGDIGRTAIWRNDLDDCYYQNHIHRLRLKKETISPLFFMNWMYYGVVLASKYFGIGNRTTIPNLSASRLKSFQFPFPPLPEQKKIAHVLSKIQQSIETQEQIIKTTQELKKALMQKLFTEGLNGEPQKQSALGGEIGPIPESWEVVELGQIVSKPIKDGVHQTPKYISNGIPFITAKDIINEEISFDTCKYISNDEHEKLFQKVNPLKDDILLTKVGTIGNVAIVRDENPFSIFVQVALIKPNRDYVDPSYLKYCLLSDKIQSEILRTSGRSTMKFIGVQKISKLVIPLPPLPIQKVISSHIDLLTDKIKFELVKVEWLKQLFKTSLNNLMTGQIRVKDMEFEPNQVPSRERI